MGSITRTFANQIKTGGKLDADGLDLTDTFAFTGTVTGAGLSGWSEDGANNNLLPASSSAGIYLGVNSATAANLLDDYEEGTHTPTVTPETSGTLGFGTGSTVMSYIKIGNRVFVNGYLLFSTVSSPVGNYFNTTLPFAIKTGLASDSEWGGGAVAFYDISATTYYRKTFVFTAGNSHFTTYINLATELQVNDRFAFSFSYQSA